MEVSVKSLQSKRKIEWATFKFPPINLWNMYPTPAMIKIHAETLDPTLWDDYETEVI